MEGKVILSVQEFMDLKDCEYDLFVAREKIHELKYQLEEIKEKRLNEWHEKNTYHLENMKYYKLSDYHFENLIRSLIDLGYSDFNKMTDIVMRFKAKYESENKDENKVED